MGADTCQYTVNVSPNLSHKPFFFSQTLFLPSSLRGASADGGELMMKQLTELKEQELHITALQNLLGDGEETTELTALNTLFSYLLATTCDRVT